MTDKNFWTVPLGAVRCLYDPFIVWINKRPKIILK